MFDILWKKVRVKFDMEESRPHNNQKIVICIDLMVNMGWSLMIPLIDF